MKKEKIYVVKCKECGKNFAYTQQDINEHYIQTGSSTVGVIYGGVGFAESSPNTTRIAFIKCPHCGAILKEYKSVMKSAITWLIIVGSIIGLSIGIPFIILNNSRKACIVAKCPDCGGNVLRLENPTYWSSDYECKNHNCSHIMHDKYHLHEGCYTNVRCEKCSYTSKIYYPFDWLK